MLGEGGWEERPPHGAGGWRATLAIWLLVGGFQTVLPRAPCQGCLLRSLLGPGVQRTDCVLSPLRPGSGVPSLRIRLGFQVPSLRMHLRSPARLPGSELGLAVCVCVCSVSVVFVSVPKGTKDTSACTPVRLEPHVFPFIAAGRR